jgi:hypothetical protein
MALDERRSHNGLTAVADINALDADDLLAAVPEPPKCFNLTGIRLQQPGGGRPQGRDAPVASMTATNRSQDRHSGRVGAGHLDSQGCLDLVLGLRGLD